MTYALLVFFTPKSPITGLKSDPSSLTALEFEFVKSNLAPKCLHIDHNPFSPQELLYPLLSIPYSLQIANKETKLQRGLFNMKDKIRKQYRTLNQPLPSWLKDWLNFIPAAVMAALVAPDVFLYGGSFNPNPLDNLFLLAAIAATVFCLIVRNFFATIVFAMAFVAGMRYFGLAS